MNRSYKLIIFALFLSFTLPVSAKSKNGWHDLADKRGFCKSIWYGPLAADKSLSPSDGECAFAEAAESIKLDERKLSNTAKPRFIKALGYYDNNVAYKYLFTFYISRTDFYREDLNQYFEDILDWNGDDCEVKRSLLRKQTVQLLCLNEQSNIKLMPASSKEKSSIPDTFTLQMEYIPKFLRD